MYRAYVILSLIALAICALPLLGVVWSSWFAEAHGCVLNEAGANPCIVNGKDWGGLLGGAFISGWLMLLTLPLGAAILALLVVVTLIRALRRRMQ